MKKLIMSAVAAFAMAMSAAAGVCKIGENGTTEYETLDAAVNAAQPGDMIYLTADVKIVGNIDWTLNNFAGINLNGHDLETTGYFWNGTDWGRMSDTESYRDYPTQYGKKIIIPDGSTLTIAGQFALKGAPNEVDVHDSGKIICRSSNYSFKWYNVKLSFFGAADEARVIGTGAKARFAGDTAMKFVFNKDAFESAKTVAPIELQNTSAEEYSGVFVSNATIEITGADWRVNMNTAIAAIDIIASKFGTKNFDMGSMQTSGTVVAPIKVVAPIDGDTIKIEIYPFDAVFFDAEGKFIDGFESFESAIDAARGGVTRYAGATLKLFNDVSVDLNKEISAGSKIYKYDLENANFAVLDLNGKNLTVRSNFWNGGDSNVATYPKKFAIPEGSVLTVSSQFKMNGANNEIEIAGTVNLPGEWFNFPNAKFTFKGPNPKLNITGTNFTVKEDGTKQYHAYFTPNGNVTFDFDGVTAAYTRAPIYVAVGNVYFSGHVFFKNTGAINATAVPLVERASTSRIDITINGNKYGDAISSETNENDRNIVYVNVTGFVFANNGRCYPTFDAMKSYVQEGDTIKLIKNVDSSYITLDDYKFSVLDLNGFNLTFSSSLVNGNKSSTDPNAKPTQYGKKFIIPSNSTLTFNGQCKMNSTNPDRWNEFIVEGILNANGEWHNYWNNIKFIIKGPNAQVNYNGKDPTDSAYNEFVLDENSKLVFDFTGMTEPWGRAPFFGNGRTMKCLGSIEYINDNFTRPGKIPLMQVTKDKAIQMTGLSVTEEDEYNVIYKEVKGTVAVDGVKVKISSDELTSKFGGTMPTTAQFQATQANGLPFLDCYVLGLNKDVASSKPFINKRKASESGKLKLGLDNVTVNTASGVTPKFTLKASSDNSSFAAVGAAQTEPEFEIDLPSEKLKYYRIGYSFE